MYYMQVVDLEGWSYLSLWGPHDYIGASKIMFPHSYTFWLTLGTGVLTEMSGVYDLIVCTSLRSCLEGILHLVGSWDWSPYIWVTLRVGALWSTREISGSLVTLWEGIPIKQSVHLTPHTCRVVLTCVSATSIISGGSAGETAQNCCQEPEVFP